MRHCAFCSTELPEQAQFCGYCGRFSRLSGEQPQNRAVPSSTWLPQDEPTVISNTSLPTMIHEQTVLYSQQEERTLSMPLNNAIWTPPVPQQSSAKEEQDRTLRARVGGMPSYPQSSQQTQFEQHNRWVQTPTVSSTGAQAAKGAVMQWMIVVFTAVLVLTTAGVGVALAVSPSLSLSGGLNGNSPIVPGQQLTFHGSGFLPGGHVTLKRDSDQNVQIAAQNRMVVGRKIASPAMVALSAVSLATPAASSVTVNATGTFDASLLVGKNWGPGEHTIRATEDMFSRSATMTVNVDDAPPSLSVSPANLDFASVQKGTKTSLSLAIGNTGGKPLAWTAVSAGANWLKLQSTSGDVLPDGGPQSLTVSCDTTSLTLGVYSATIHMRTDGGNIDVKVSLHVVAQKQAKLSVSTATLDLQTMDAGQQATKVISISNTGTMKLDWQITGDENWVSLAPASGSIQPDGLAQRVNVQVDTTGLQARSYSATLMVGSNGGAIRVTVFVVVSAPLSPLPTPTPISPPPIPTQMLPTATPTQVPQGSICQLSSSLDFGTVPQGQTSTQPLTLGNCGDASFIWRAQVGNTWVAIDNSGSTLDPNTTTTIKVTVDTTAFSAPGTYQSTLTFYTSVGNQTVNITVTVAQPTPTPTPKPTSVPIS